MAEPKTFTKSITKELDDHASAELGRELCQVLEEIDIANTYRKEFNSEMKEKIDALVIKKKELKTTIESKKLDINIECFEEEDFETSSIRTVRVDTKEVVDTRAMSADERRKAMQMPLPIADGPDAKVISMTQHSHDEDGAYHESCSACWSTRERPPMPVVDDETALAESVGPGNKLPKPEPTDEELDEAVEANIAHDEVESDDDEEMDA